MLYLYLILPNLSCKPNTKGHWCVISINVPECWVTANVVTPLAMTWLAAAIVSPLLPLWEMKMQTSLAAWSFPGVIKCRELENTDQLIHIPRSPCAHSAACIYCDGIPIELRVAASLAAMCPDFPVILNRNH